MKIPQGGGSSITAPPSFTILRIILNANRPRIPPVPVTGIFGYAPGACYTFLFVSHLVFRLCPISPALPLPFFVTPIDPGPHSGGHTPSPPSPRPNMPSFLYHGKRVPHFSSSLVDSRRLFLRTRAVRRFLRSTFFVLHDTMSRAPTPLPPPLIGGKS